MPKLPDYLASLNFQNPNDRHNSFFGYAHETDLSMYEWLQAHPEQLAIFNNFQSASAQSDEASVQLILKDLLLPDSHGEILDQNEGCSGKVLLVDVGGGQGESLRKFRKHMPGLRGRLIVQDLPKVTESQPVEKGEEAMSHDFFTLQPVKGTPSLIPRDLSLGSSSFVLLALVD